MTKTLGFIGAGMIGGTLAHLAIAAGIEVVLSNSRGPETLADLVGELGDGARAATPAEAAAAGDLVVATIPLVAYDRLPAEALAGKTVLDTMNYYPQRDGRIPVLDSGELTSSALVQRHLAGAHVVKASNNIIFSSLRVLARPAGAPDRSALPIAGDFPEANAEATALLDALGYDTVDAGPLADSWRFEPGTPAYTQPYMPGQPPENPTMEELQHWFADTPSVPVPAERLRELLDSAVRGPVGGFLPEAILS
ncbi:NAD(P)-binding domain-containing protein [Amycolatopsis sp. NPDC005961]|uniref:NAD(P)-binding domain-containing protein n=1 Tax=Amycolatopsis sp. NPDC005961 TaxID=3156720 RepID=UPI0033EEFD18